MRDLRKDLWIICEEGGDDQRRDIGVILPGVCIQEIREYQDRTGIQVANTFPIAAWTDYIVANALDYSDFKGDKQYEYILWTIRNAYDLLLCKDHIKKPLQFFAVAEERIKNIPEEYAVAIRKARKELPL